MLQMLQVLERKLPSLSQTKPPNTSYICVELCHRNRSLHCNNILSPTNQNHHSPQHVYSKTEPARSYKSTEPPQQINYSRPELPPQVNYSRHEPQKYMYYSREEPPQYSYYSIQQPEKHTYYTRQEQNSEDCHNGNGNITSVFSDAYPDACAIV